jgi:hypothetical protein
MGSAKLAANLDSDSRPEGIVVTDFWQYPDATVTGAERPNSDRGGTATEEVCRSAAQ